jgi:alkanesulfonate monooxygenase SsuD/methylene tetrahydromethanopterin reductase-like flavin-dependent oxidoreductase (luciferase family)
MRIGLMIEGQEGVSWEQWLALAEAAERTGLESLFRSDHYRSIALGEPAGSLDAWAILAALAARTERIRLGTLVSPITFRAASVLAKNVVTVDHISGGRVELGIGAGWYEPEHLTYGFPFGTLGSRLDELDRQLAEIIRQWTAAEEILPKPVQQPRPPIIVGGRGKPRTIAAAARFADEYNLITPSVEEARDCVATLAEATGAAGREPLRFSMMTGCIVGRHGAQVAERLASYRALTGSADGSPQLCGTIDEIVAQLSEYEAAGVQRAMLRHLDHSDVEMLADLGEVASRLAGAGS